MTGRDVLLVLMTWVVGLLCGVIGRDVPSRVLTPLVALGFLAGYLIGRFWS
jgi:hypothetical protein